MITKYYQLFLVLLLCIATSCKTTQQTSQQPKGKEAKREFRGAWIQTAFQGEYKNMTPAQMRKDFVRKLNYLQRCGINAIIFQVRQIGYRTVEQFLHRRARSSPRREL